MSLKPSIVQEYANKATELNTIEGELYMIDKSLDQESPENDRKFAQKREKDRFLQQDLIDQFNQIRAKELRLLQNEEKFAKEKAGFNGKVENFFDQKLEKIKLESEISLLSETFKITSPKELSFHTI